MTETRLAAERIRAPFTPEQVDALNLQQADPRRHPYTCEEWHGEPAARRNLVATTRGRMSGAGTWRSVGTGPSALRSTGRDPGWTSIASRNRVPEGTQSVSVATAKAVAPGVRAPSDSLRL